MISVGLARHDDRPSLLGAVCWCHVGGRVRFRCPECGSHCDVRADQIDAKGDVDFGGWDGPLFVCKTATCGYVRGIRIEGWKPLPVFDVGGES